jgi:hypothetical protein
MVMRAVLLSGITLLLCIVLAQERRTLADVREGDTDLSYIDDSPSEEWDQLQEARKNQADVAQAAMRNMMLGLRFEEQEVPTVRIPFQRGLNVCFMSPFRDTVFFAAYHQGRARQGFPHPVGYYLAPTDHKIHRIRVQEVDDVRTAVAIGERAWFVGLANGRTILVGVGRRDHITLPLPKENEIPDLGMDGQSLLVVYSKTIYRLTDRQWTFVYSGDTTLSYSELPPQQHGNMVFLHGIRGDNSPKYLWLLTMVGERPHPQLFARDIVLAEPAVWSTPWATVHLGIAPPNWGEVSSYCVMSNGDLWACAAHGSDLVRRSKDGSYAIAIANGSVRPAEDLSGSVKTRQGVSVSAVTALSDDTLLLAGRTGLYRLRGNRLVQELAFEEAFSYGDWRPTHVVLLDDGSYIIACDSYGGIYWLHEADDGEWTCLPVDEGSPIVW